MSSVLSKKSLNAHHAIKAAGGIVTAVDLAKLWKVTPQYAHRVTRGEGFPEPVLRAGRVKAWVHADVELYRQQAKA